MQVKKSKFQMDASFSTFGAEEEEYFESVFAALDSTSGNDILDRLRHEKITFFELEMEVECDDFY